MLIALEQRDLPNIIRGSGMEIFLPCEAQPTLSGFPGIDSVNIRYYDPRKPGSVRLGDCFLPGIEDVGFRDRLILGPDGLDLPSKPDFVSFLEAGLKERDALTISGHELGLHPYKFIRMEHNSSFRHLLALKDEQRGFRQFFPKTFYLESLLMFVPAHLSVQAALSAGRLRPFFLSCSGESLKSPRDQCTRKSSAAYCFFVTSHQPEPGPPADPVNLPRKRNSLGMEFVLIPGGIFVMGTPEHKHPRDMDETQKKVNVAPFWLQTTPVTQTQYTTLNQKNPSAVLGPGLPVQGVTIFDALNFTTALAKQENLPYRLPREYEWEYACFKGGQVPELSGDPDKLNPMAWYRTNSGGIPHPVGRKRPNAFGLYDLLGNVKELTRDIYAPDYDPLHKEWTQFMRELWLGSPVSVRGGNFNSPARHLRSAARAFVVAVDYCPNPGVGFRLAMDLE